MKVLVVDDSRSVHAFVRGLFASTSHELVHVYDGSEAMALLRQNKEDYDIILLDWEMPVLNGPETAEEIRKSGITTPILMVTTKNDPKSIMFALEKGANEFMMKPFTKDILFSKLSLISGQEVA